MKVFWSWQSDTPGKTGRHFVRAALDEAVQKLKTSSDIDEPNRAEAIAAIHVDQDRQGVAGSPDLARTILEKIDASRVVIADVTPVGLVEEKRNADGELITHAKKIMNPNVAIELGYALSAITDEYLIMVCNKHYGDRDNLPFDLRHKAGPIFYTLAPNADNQTMQKQKKELVNAFVIALRPYLEATAPSPQEDFRPNQTTFNSAAYFQPNQTLAKVGDPNIDEVEFGYDQRSLAFLRLHPVSRLQSPLSLADIRLAATKAPFLSQQFLAGIVATNEYGAIRFEPRSNPAPEERGHIWVSTQIFRNGEIWAISANMIVTKRGANPPFVPIPMMQLAPAERTFRRCLPAMLGFMDEHLRLGPPWKLKVGLTGLRGVNYAIENDFHGPVQDSEVLYETILNSSEPETLNPALIAFFELIHDAAGYRRPTNFDGFPST